MGASPVALLAFAVVVGAVGLALGGGAGRLRDADRRGQAPLERADIRSRDAMDPAVAGMASDDLSRMFTRFDPAATAAGIQGTGIGLHFTRELVQLHGGSIDVTSIVGRGTTFLVRLPFGGSRTRRGESAAA